MRQTYTAEKTLEILQTYGIPEVDLDELIERAEKIAWARNSQVMGFRHLVIAAGVTWGNSVEAPPAELPE